MLNAGKKNLTRAKKEIKIFMARKNAIRYFFRRCGGNGVYTRFKGDLSLSRSNDKRTAVRAL